MTVSSITLPTAETVAVLHATDKNGAAGSYFNGKRLGMTLPMTLQLYRVLVPKLQDALVQQIEASGLQFDAIVCPPSSGNDAQPYREAILSRWPVNDFTDTFTRMGRIKAQNIETTVDDLVEREFVHTPKGHERSIKSILIVDEAIATGKSAAALIELLRRAGMPPDARVSIAVCSKMN
jgi:hypothetical protein